MPAISEYLSKTIISIYEASIVGTIVSANFDKKMRRICSLIVVEDKDNYNEYIVPINRVLTQDSAITIKNLNSVKPYQINNLYVKCPINLSVYSSCGEYRGVVKDVIFDEESYSVIELILDSCTIPQSEIASVSQTLVITKGEGFTGLQAPRKRRSKPKVIMSHDTPHQENKPIEEVNKEIYEVVSPEEASEEIYEEVILREPIHDYDNHRSNIPARIISDYSFLLGRYVIADIYSITGELIIAANSIINEKIVDIARRNGKLVEITVGSRLTNQ